MMGDVKLVKMVAGPNLCEKVDIETKIGDVNYKHQLRLCDPIREVLNLEVKGRQCRV